MSSIAQAQATHADDLDSQGQVPTRSTENVAAPQGSETILRNFDSSRIYVDGYAEDSALVNDTNPVVKMDDYLRKFLKDTVGLDPVYIATILEPNGILEYKDFHKLFVDTHSFRDAEHIYHSLGPNALALYWRQTQKLMLLGYYIHKASVTLRDDTTGVFLPGVFDSQSWRKFCDRRTRYEFEQRFEQASSVTYIKHEASLQLDESSVARTFVDLHSPTSSRYSDDVTAKTKVWNQMTHLHANSVRPQDSHGPGPGNFPSSLSSIAKVHSQDGAVALESRVDTRHQTSFDVGYGAPPADSFRIHTQTEDPSDPSDGSSTGSSALGSSALGSSASNGYGSSSDSGGSGSSSTDSSDYDDQYTTSESSSSDDDSGRSRRSESSDDTATDSSSVGHGYRPPRSNSSFMQRIRKYERHDQRKKKASSSSTKQKKPSSSSKTTKKASRHDRHKSSHHSRSHMRGHKKKKKKRSHYSSSYRRTKRHSTKKRSVLTITPWDGTTSFLDVFNKVRNFVEQQDGMHYIVQDSFIKAYRNDQHRKRMKALGISRAQFDSDQRVLHAYLCAAFETYTNSRDILDKYRTSRDGNPDGIRAFRRLKAEWYLGGDAFDAHLSVLKRKYATPYDVRYRGGLAKYVTDYEAIVSEIARYRGKKLAKVPDQDNCLQLLNNLAPETAIRHIYASAHTVNTTNPGNFRMLCSHIRKMAINQADLTRDQHRIQRHARLAAVDDDVEDDTDTPTEHNGVADLIAMLGASNRNDTLVPKLLWQSFPREIQKLILEIRAELDKGRKPEEVRESLLKKEAKPPQVQDRNANLLTMADPDPELSRRANLASNHSPTDASSDTDGSEDSSDVDDHQRRAMNTFAEILKDKLLDDSKTRYGNVVRIVRCNYDRLTTLEEGYPEPLYALSSEVRKELKVGFTTGDSGADSCILGDGYREQGRNIGQFANVHGFDSVAAKKMNLPIGTGDTVLYGHSSDDPTRYFEFIARYHNSVLNFGSKTSLASENQIRSNGHIVDTVHRKHKRDLDGNHGTQCMTLRVPEHVDMGSIKHIVVPFTQKRGLMVMDHRYPQDEDYKSLPIIEVTSPDPWDPRDATDSNNVAKDAAGILRNLNDIHMERVAENVATMPMDDPANDLELPTNGIANITMDDSDTSQTAADTRKQDIMEVDGDVFHDAQSPDDDNEHTWFISDDFTVKAKVQPENSDEDMSYFPCYSSEKELCGNAFHLTIDFQAMLAQGNTEHAFLRSNDVDDFLSDATWEELTGYVQGTTEVDTTAYVLRSVRAFQEDHDLEMMRPNFGFRPVDVIRKTLENTTQYAKAFSPFPMHRHWHAMYKWFNFKRLPETICTDTAFSSVPAAVTGETCAQLYYGVTSKMMNIYGMWSKGQAEDTYRDFIREEGIPTRLHRDNSGEQKSDGFKETNRVHHVKDSWTEPYHPHQNPAETRAMAFLKRVATSLIIMSGAPMGLWLYAMKYVVMINNWTSHESLGWKTPYEKRHGVPPDISPLLAYRFYQQVYYFIDDGFPDSGERLGYILGVNENVGSHMTFDILTDDHQTIIARSVLRPVDSPTPNRGLKPSEELDPVIRIADRDAAKTDLVNTWPPTADANDGDNLFTEEPLKMHLRKKRRRTRKHKVKADIKGKNKRKDLRTREQNKHAPSNKKRKKIVRFGKQPPSIGHNPSDSSLHDDDHELFIIDEILDHRRNRYSGEPEVLVSWQDYDESHDSWEPVTVIRETAAETLAEYAAHHDLQAQPGWDWNKPSTPAHSDPKSDLISRSTVPVLRSTKTPTVEGRSKRNKDKISIESQSVNPISSMKTRSKKAKSQVQEHAPNVNANKTRPQKRVTRLQTRKANSTVTRDDKSLLLNNLLATFGMAKDNTGGLYTLKNYEDFTEKGFTTEEQRQNTIPLETTLYEHHGTDVSAHLAKVLELQELDKFVEKEDEWTIVKVLTHATRRKTRRLPNGTNMNETVKDKHVRLKVMFIDGSVKWIAMDAVLLQDPMPIVEYAKRMKLLKDPKFNIVETITKDKDKMQEYRRAFKAKVSKAPRYHFGVEIPRNVTHAALLDKVNGNKLWEEATGKELKSINDHKVFRRVSENDDMTEYKRIPYQIIFDCKHDGRRKARLVAGGHMTAPPTEDVYSGVVGMDTVRLAFAIGAMQGLEVCAADIATAFLYGKTREKVYIIAGPEFGPELEGQKLIVQGGLYGLKTSAARYHETCSAVLRKLGFKPTKIDADLYIRKKGDHYEYLATYVDDILAWGKEPLKIIKEVEKSFKLRDIGFPDYYLGADVNPVEEPRLREEGFMFGMSAKSYISGALKRLGDMLDSGPFHKASSPMVETYHPEQETSPFLTPENISKYRALIGSANWIVTLGRFDIAYATSTLARYSMAPREGHLIALKRVFGYLTKFPNGELLVNPKPFEYPPDTSKGTRWQEFYPDAEEELPPDRPTPLNKKAQITIYVDADHAHDTVTRRSVTGILVFINQTLVRYVSKRQKTVETSSYGSELVASRIATELAMEYRYAVRMMGLEVDGPVHMFGDNNSVIINTTLPSSMLKKKHQSIAYHAVRTAQASGVISFKYTPSAQNWADVCTKPLPPGKLHALIKPLLFRRSGYL